MRLQINEPWLFFDAMTVDLGNFSIITGLNGSGKTQLLKALSTTENQTNLYDTKTGSLVSSNEIKYIAINGLNPTLSFQYGDTPMTRGGSINQDPINVVIHNYERIKEKIKSEIANHKPDELGVFHVKDYQKEFPKYIGEIAHALKKSPFELSAEDIRDNYKRALGIPATDMFSHDFGLTIGAYELEKVKNDFYAFSAKKYSQLINPYLEDEDFIAKHGENPSNKINELMLEFNLPFKLVYTVHLLNSVYISIVNIITGQNVSVSDMSSGEKVLLSLVIAVYNSPIGTPFPKVLLLDEPDSSLHPSIIKTFLDSIKNVFVDQRSMTIIMTTHSPSTIALAPDESDIYVLKNYPTALEKISRDMAINELTVGIPTLSVNINNRRVVFVESDYDVKFFTQIHTILKNSLNANYSVEFVSSGFVSTEKENVGPSGCTQVKHLLKTLMANNIRNVFGLIDYDNVNQPSKNLFVLGSRNGIENYIYDPIPLAAFLMKKTDLATAMLNFPKEIDYHLVDSLDETNLQLVSNKIVELLTKNVDKKILDSREVPSKYFNEKQINIPAWFVEYDDHNLEELIKITFTELRAQSFQNEGSLKLAIIHHVFAKWPGLIPIELVNAMRMFS